MSDSDLAGNAWKLPPSEYLLRRPALYEAPSAPQSQYVTMRDGCRIAVDVYLPEGTPAQSKLATIAIFTPYNRRFKVIKPGVEPTPNAAKYRDFFVPRGYALVVVDVRGTGASFGIRDSMRSPNEREDSREIADWIVAQPWSSGVIGSTGISYLGAAACFLASTGHPAVKAIAPLFSVSDMYSEQLFPGGMLSRVWSRDYTDMMFGLDRNDAALTSKFAYFNDPGLSGPQPVDEDADESLLAAAIAEHHNNFSLHDMMPELAFRDEGPLHAPHLKTDACSPYTYLLDGIRPDVAIYSVSGWCDGGGYANGSISRFLTRRGEHDMLLLGPWDHGARTNVSPWRDKPASSFPLLAEVLRFFDEHLLGMETGISAERPVHYYSLHADRWHAASDWPRLPAMRLFPNEEGRLDRDTGSSSIVDYRVDFSASTGSNTRWERLGGANVEDYYFDWDGRDNALLNFTSEPFPEDTEITGHIIARIRLASSQPDAAVFVYAAEVDSDGRATYITEGMLRALHRAEAEAPPSYQVAWPYRRFFRADAKPLTPGEYVSFSFALLPVSWTLKRGSRLRLSIAGADEAHFPAIPNGAPPMLSFALGGSQGCSFDIPLRAKSLE